MPSSIHPCSCTARGWSHRECPALYHSQATINQSKLGARILDTFHETVFVTPLCGSSAAWALLDYVERLRAVYRPHGRSHEPSRRPCQGSVFPGCRGRWPRGLGHIRGEVNVWPDRNRGWMETDGGRAFPLGRFRRGRALRYPLP